METPEWVWLVGGLLLIVVLYEAAPKWAGWLLVLLVLAYLVRNADKVVGA